MKETANKTNKAAAIGTQGAAKAPAKPAPVKGAPPTPSKSASKDDITTK